MRPACNYMQNCLLPEEAAERDINGVMVSVSVDYNSQLMHAY